MDGIALALLKYDGESIIKWLVRVFIGVERMGWFQRIKWKLL